MKTKLTLFIAVIAIALFGMGCASIKNEPPVPAKNEPPVPHAVQWNGNWYAVFKERLSWDAAKANCENLGGHLVVIESESENHFVLALLKNEKFLQEALKKNPINFYVSIGCYRQEGRQWNWVTGQPLKYANWSKVSPLHSHKWGAITLTKVNGFPEVNPNDWVVLDRGEYVYVCEWE